MLAGCIPSNGCFYVFFKNLSLSASAKVHMKCVLYRVDKGIQPQKQSNLKAKKKRLSNSFIFHNTFRTLLKIYGGEYGGI